MSACPCETLLFPCTHLTALGGVRQHLQPQTIKRLLNDAIGGWQSSTAGRCILRRAACICCGLPVKLSPICNPSKEVSNARNIMRGCHCTQCKGLRRGMIKPLKPPILAKRAECNSTPRGRVKRCCALLAMVTWQPAWRADRALSCQAGMQRAVQLRASSDALELAWDSVHAGALGRQARRGGPDVGSQALKRGTGGNVLPALHRQRHTLSSPSVPITAPEQYLRTDATDAGAVGCRAMRQRI